MNFFSDLQHDYEDKASKWLVNFQGPNFDIPEELKENVGLIGAMCHRRSESKIFSKLLAIP